MRILPLIVAALAAVTPAEAQTAPACRVVCMPQVLVEPTFTVENPGRAPRIASPSGVEEEIGRETVFEVILALGIATRFPRLGFTAEAIFAPFGKTDANPFTGKAAKEIGASDIRDNPVTLEFEVNLGVIESGQTGGWVSSHVDLVDKFGPAGRPGDDAVYTHKLNVEWDTAVVAFKWLPEGHWLRKVEVEGSLDYVATGIPRAGDELHGTRYVTDASPWSFSIVLVIPVID